MKNAKASLILLFIFAISSSNALAAIYGADDRKDMFQVPWLKPFARSVAVAVPGLFLKPLPNGNWQMTEVEKLAGSSTAYACNDERFGNQPTIGNCTGFLIGDRYVVTAGHCVLNTGVVDNDEQSPFCAAFRWYFDFNMNASGQTTVQNIPKDKVYGCKRIIHAETTDNENDFALLELDRPVTADMIPLIANSSPIPLGSKVYTIGHPAGLPAKYSGQSPVSANKNPFYFESFMDTAGGNSGGPVFNSANQVVGILVSGHQVSFYRAKNGIPQGCYRWNTCNADGTKCSENSTVSTLQLSNYVQRLDVVLKYLPKKN